MSEQALQDLLNNALGVCGVRGMQPPFVICVIDADETPFWLRTDSTEVEIHGIGVMPKSPKTILVIDKDHVQAKILVTEGGTATWQ
jgi:hypothetical protein